MKTYEQFYNKWRDYDLLTCILAMIGLIIAIIDVRLFINLAVRIYILELRFAIKGQSHEHGFH